jgi:hypothetical protein
MENILSVLLSTTSGYSFDIFSALVIRITNVLQYFLSIVLCRSHNTEYVKIFTWENQDVWKQNTWDTRGLSDTDKSNTNGDEVRFVLDQQSADRHVTLLGHIILIPSQRVFDLSP